MNGNNGSTMKTGIIAVVVWTMAAGFGAALFADQTATVTQAVNEVTHGTSSSSSDAPAKAGTVIHDGEYVETHSKSRAELQLPATIITRLGANTVFNYTAGSNTVDLQQGDILFCKPPEARKLNIITAGVTAGITGTTGFVSIQSSGRKPTYILGIIEGHTVAHANGLVYPLGRGDVVQFTPGQKPFIFSFDVPRFVKSTPLLSKSKYSSTLPNQGAIDKALAEYADDVSRGFITAPSKSIDYSGGIPVLSTVAYSSAQNAQAQRGNNAPGAASSPSQTYSPGNGGYNPYNTSPGH